MSKIVHHIPEDMLAAYAAGTLPHGFAATAAPRSRRITRLAVSSSKAPDPSPCRTG